MNTNIRFLLALPLGLLTGMLLWSGLYAIQLGASTDSSRWLNDVLLRKEQVLASMPAQAPRLLVLGGSNVLFGVSAEQLRTRLGMDVVNLGSYAGLPLDYLLERSTRSLRPGDTALLVLEYEYFLWRGDLSEQGIDFLVARDPQYLRDLPFVQRMHVLFGVSPERLWKGLRVKLWDPGSGMSGTGYYDAKALNEWGDQTNNLHDAMTEADIAVRDRLIEPLWPEHTVRSGHLPPTPEAIATLLAFRSWCTEHDVRLLSTFPGYLYFPAFKGAGRTAFARIARWLADEGFDPLGAPDDFFYARSEFLDTNYHLHDLARVRRTARMAELLLAAGLPARPTQTASASKQEHPPDTPHPAARTTER